MSLVLLLIAFCMVVGLSVRRPSFATAAATFMFTCLAAVAFLYLYFRI